LFAKIFDFRCESKCGRQQIRTGGDENGGSRWQGKPVPVVRDEPERESGWDAEQ
jgi:hypothetical protein